jgi:hypothetical protein
MLFFSLLCPQGVNSTNFGKSPINNQPRRQGVSYLTPLVNLVHSERQRRHDLAPRLRSGAALRCQGSAWCIRDMQHTCNLHAWKRWRSSWHYALNRINDTECLVNWARFRRFARKMFRNSKWFSNFSVLCECSWWKLLVHSSEGQEKYLREPSITPVGYFTEAIKNNSRAVSHRDYCAWRKWGISEEQEWFSQGYHYFRCNLRAYRALFCNWKWITFKKQIKKTN